MSDSTFAKRFNTRAIPGLNREFAVDVTFGRGHLISQPFKARRIARFTQAMGQELNGVDIKVEMREYLLPVDQVLLDGVPAQPISDDLIVEGGETWKVHFPDEATPPSELSSTGSDWITRVKRVKDASTC